MPFIDRSFACRLEMAHAWRCAKYTEAQQALHPADPIAVEPVAGGYACYAGDGSPVNRAIGLGFQGAFTAADRDQVEQFYHRQNTLSRIDACPLADPSLLEQLNFSRYRLEEFYSVLACSLPEDVIAVPVSPKVQISQAKPAEADLWLKTVAQGFSEEEIPSQKTLDILAPNFYSTNALCFFAWMDGQPVGGGAIYTHAGVAEFGGASTRPGFRRQGVQMALLQTRLIAARQQGCDVAMVVTSPGSDSQRNAERAGFRLAYTRPVMVEGER